MMDAMSNREQLAAEARAAIARAGISQAEIAMELGVTTRTVGKKLHGETPLSIEEVGIIARVTGANPGAMVNAAFGITDDKAAA